jgi:2-polyprenyl-6-methoxyphenol hydroxylase-like FAD-dependent oxidoreductase
MGKGVRTTNPDDAASADARAPGRVLVVGAGPTGLMAAACLARFGVSVRLIDRAVAPPADRSRAVVIQPRTLEAFDNLGIVDEVIAAGMLVDRLNLFHPSGRHGTLRFATPGVLDSPYDKLLSLPQDETERILGALANRYGVIVERGVELATLTQTEHAVRVGLKHDDGSTEDVDFAYVIGCDGAHSTVRTLSGLDFPGLTYRDEGLIGDVKVHWKLPSNEVSLCPHAEGFLLAFPLPGEHHFRTIMIVPRDDMREDRHLGFDEYRAQLERMVPRGFGDGDGPPTILEANWLTRYRLHRRGVTCYQKGRCFVAGDAAHIHSPVGAQGMNTGIQDAYNLTWKIALVLRGEAPAWIIDTYDEERRRVGELLLNRTDRAFGFVAGHGWLSRTIRRIAPTIGARLLNAPIVGRRLARFVSQLGIRYRHSRLSVNGPAASGLGANAPRAGDRAPDVVLDPTDNRSSSRLFDALRQPRHTLFVFEGSGDVAWADDVERRVAPFAPVMAVVQIKRRRGNEAAGWLIDGDGRAHARYGADGGACYLVRPDGYIGFRGAAADVGALIDDLGRRFVSG